MNNEIQTEVATKGDSATSAYYRAETASSKENNQILRQMDVKESFPKHVLPDLVIDMGGIVRQDARVSMPGTLQKDSTASIPGTLPKDAALVLPQPRMPQSKMPQWGPSSDTTGNNNPKPVEANVPKVSALSEKNSDMAVRIPYPTKLVNVQKGESKPKY